MSAEIDKFAESEQGEKQTEMTKYSSTGKLHQFLSRTNAADAQ